MLNYLQTRSRLSPVQIMQRRKLVNFHSTDHCWRPDGLVGLQCYKRESYYYTAHKYICGSMVGQSLVAGFWSSAIKMEGSVITIHAEKQAGYKSKPDTQYICQTADTDQYLTNLHRTTRRGRRSVWLALRNLLKSSVSSTQDCDRHATLQLQPAVTSRPGQKRPPTTAVRPWTLTL